MVVAGDVGLRTAAGEDVRRTGAALALIDGVRPGVSQRTGEAAAHALVQLDGQPVVPAIESGVDDVDARVASVHAVLSNIDGSGVTADLGAGGIVDAVIDGRSGGADVDIVDGGQVQAAAPDVGSRDGQGFRQLVFEGDIGLLGIGGAEVLGRDVQADGSHR